MPVEVLSRDVPNGPSVRYPPQTGAIVSCVRANSTSNYAVVTAAYQPLGSYPYPS
jgi:hypothetical protein